MWHRRDWAELVVASVSARLDRLAELEQAATPGPWLHRTGPDDDWNVVQVDVLRFFEASHDRPESQADATLIAESRNALPALIAIARAAERCMPPIRLLAESDDEPWYLTGAAVTELADALARLDADPAGEEACG